MASWYRNMWELARSMKRVLRCVLLYFNWCLLLVKIRNYYYYYYYYLLQLSFHSVTVVLRLVTNKNEYI
jgi:hypothetical protein